MALITEADWLALKSEWMLGVQSDRALCRKYKVDKTQLRRRIFAEGWVRPSKVAELIEQEITEKSEKLITSMRDGIGDGAEINKNNVLRLPLRNNPKNGSNSPGGDGAPVKRPRGRPPGTGKPLGPRPPMPPPMSPALKRAAAAEMQTRAIETAITTLQQAMVAHLAGGARMRGIAIAIANLAMKVLTGTQEESLAAQEKLFAGGGNMSHALITLARLEESIIKVERSALGLDQQRVNVTLNDPAAGGPQVKSDPETGKPVIDVTQLPDAHLEALGQVLERLKAARSVDLPLPPKGPERL